MSLQFTVRRWGAGLAAALLLGATVPATAASDTAGYFNPPKFASAKLSPSGNRLALVVKNDEGFEALAVMDLPPTQPPRVLQSYPTAHVTDVNWVNDQRLVFRVTEPRTDMREDGSGIFAIDHDGADEVMLTSRRLGNNVTESRVRSRVLPYNWSLHDTLDDGSDDVILEEVIYDALRDPIGRRLGRVDSKTGVLQALTAGTDASYNGIEWEFDRQGTMRAIRTRTQGRDRLLTRRSPQDEWKTLWDRDLLADDTLSPVQFENDHELIVQSSVGGDTSGLHVLDTLTGKVDPEPLLRVARYDIESAIVDKRAGRVVGAQLTAGRPMTVWFSERMTAIQKSVDLALPERFNTIACGRCESSRFYVVFSQTDKLPGEFILYDHEKKSLSPIGSMRPWIDPSRQGRRSFHWTQARDGLPLSVVVTHPAGHDGKEALPAIVVVHGGPWAEGSDRSWSGFAQFFASRGYRVIEPNFRGTTGYGRRAFNASIKQWGQSMQDDLADSVQWAAKEGLIDAKRVCIFGGSYGGYAALMGPVKHPDAYRCAVSVNGVTDIQLMFTSARADATRNSLLYSMPRLVGDPDKDAAMLRENSPVARAADIKVPVLLVQGGRDRRVPKEHADDFEAAARKAGVKIERVDYPDEYHSFIEVKNIADFADRSAAFIDRVLKP
ncbi:alpha/beta hydrolase family protein [Rubrivivax gelatinosus]|uniref:Dipeptidyl aminopeptidase/acylaminoacyl peptidase n=1 Tax=Rubrivivax gelatinosus TaxID=28068 RepID=A0A4R2M0N8_RUBGE|nr:alpha/beta fold hydrolase [Rubrivivax gelatinosus]MBK1687056.1 hypothetical protein [Rubrivivax gelatinosus]TCP00569.1 dipeptidyl aminopeptidase/acylaminoacyl peptidase [Rubrivivax gelatinosus]